MDAFEKVIGYTTIKNEMSQILDMIQNKEVYEKLGAQMPKGVLLYGAPGLGKTLLCTSFMEASGLPSFTIRRRMSDNAFIDEINATFERAKENAPSIIFLDDLDKFSGEDSYDSDSEEFVAVQAAIDEARDSNVFVLATVNKLRKLPQSLLRPGRFDRRIEVKRPTSKDAVSIIQYYLKDKELDEDVNMEDVARMISYSSCAELETLMNEAAISAAFARKEKVGMEEITRAVLRMQYDCPDDYTKVDAAGIEQTSLHEAGHLVVAEILCPGSVGLASIRKSGRNGTGGFIHACKDIGGMEDDILISLGGKAAAEIMNPGCVASGCQSDIYRATQIIRQEMSTSATRGWGMQDVAIEGRFPTSSDGFVERNESVVQAELDRYFHIAKDILWNNLPFLQRAAEMLADKGTLLHSDIQGIVRDLQKEEEKARKKAERAAMKAAQAAQGKKTKTVAKKAKNSAIMKEKAA